MRAVGFIIFTSIRRDTFPNLLLTDSGEASRTASILNHAAGSSGNSEDSVNLYAGDVSLTKRGKGNGIPAAPEVIVKTDRNNEP